MSLRAIYTIVGLLLGAFVDLAINLLASVIQNTSFAKQFLNTSSIWMLAILIVVGLLLGYWLGGTLILPITPTDSPNNGKKSDTITITRLNALLSHSKLKGRGIHLRDVLLVGSTLEIDSKE